MKQFKLILVLLSLGTALRASATAGDAWFLTSREFARLTPREQKNYLREVQAVVGSLAERSEYFASSSKPTRSIATDEPRFNAGQIELALTQATKWRGDKNRADFQYHLPQKADDFLNEAENGVYWTVFSRMALNTLPADDPKRAELTKKVDELETFYLGKQETFKKSFDKGGSLDGAFDTMKKARDGKVTVNDDIFPKPLVEYDSKQAIRPVARKPAAAPAVPASGDIPNPPPLTPPTTPQPPVPMPPTRPASPSAEANPPPAPKPSPRPATPAQPPTAPLPPKRPAIPQEQPPVAEPETPREPVLIGYRCMYAGFVIRNDPCRGPQSLPADSKIEGLSPDNFNCGEKVLCNPLLFGVKRDCELKMGMKPDDARKCLSQSHGLCVPRSKYATRDCAQAGASDEALTSALELVKLNPDAWQEYLTSFYELCDDHMIAFNSFITTKNGQPREDEERRVRDDVDQTCSHAKKRLKEISDKYRSYDISARPEKKDAPQEKTVPPPPAHPGPDGNK